MTDAELLAWVVVFAWRDSYRKLGSDLILPGFPPCPTCGDSVIGTETQQRVDLAGQRLTTEPCGHQHRVDDEQLGRIHRHATEMIHGIDIDGRMEFGRRWTTDDVIREARARVAPAVLDNSRTTPDNPATSTIAPNSTTVQGRCPACGWTSLFLGSGGYITCGRLECPDPEAVTTLLERDVRRGQIAALSEHLTATIDEAFDDHYQPGVGLDTDAMTTAVLASLTEHLDIRAAERERDQLRTRLRLAHSARRAKEHQLDGIRRALCDLGAMQDGDPYTHADLEHVIRQALNGADR